MASIDLTRLQEQLQRISPLHLAIAMGALSALVMLIGTCGAYDDSELALPPPRPAPPPTERELVTNYRFKETFFHAVIDEDSAKFKIPKITLEDLRKPNVYRSEFNGAQRLGVGRTLVTKSLSLKALKQRLWIGQEGQSLRATHLVLQLTNKTDRHLAYRVATRSSGSCRGKGHLPHNAIAIAPGESIERTECLLRAANTQIEQVEVMELTPLGYHYASRLDPERLQYDSRTSGGHDYAGHAPCRMIPWRQIRSAIKQEEARWYDVIDFYARHNCDEYTFPVGYRWSDKGPAQLPVTPKKGDER